MKTGFATGKNGEVTVNQKCKNCGHVGLKHHTTGGVSAVQGEYSDNIHEYLVCEECGWSDDGEWRGLNPPEDDGWFWK